MQNKVSELASEIKSLSKNPAFMGLAALTLSQIACKGEGILVAGTAAIGLLIFGGFYLATRPGSTERQINRMVNDVQKREDSSPYVPQTHTYLSQRGNTDDAIRKSGGDPSGLK